MNTCLAASSTVTVTQLMLLPPSQRVKKIFLSNNVILYTLYNNMSDTV